MALENNRVSFGTYALVYPIFGFLLSVAINMVIVSLYPDALSVSIFVLLLQAMQTTLLFLLPSLLYIHKEGYIKSKITSGVKIALSIAIIVSIYPFVDALQNGSKLLIENYAPASIVEYITQQEARLKAAIELQIGGKSILKLILNITIVAGLTSVAEELFFRKMIQNRIVAKFGTHFGIILSAIIFSAVHFELTAFLSRVILGALLGYIYVYSGRIIYPIIAHFFNNAIIVVAYFITNNYLNIEKELNEFSNNSFLIIISVILTLYLVYLLRKKSLSSSSLA